MLAVSFDCSCKGTIGLLECNLLHLLDVLLGQDVPIQPFSSGIVSQLEDWPIRSYSRINRSIATYIGGSEVPKKSKKLSLLFGAKDVNCLIEEDCNPGYFQGSTDFFHSIFEVLHVWNPCGSDIHAGLQ